MTMTSKGSFKNIGKDSIVSETTAGIKVYLESTDDQYILTDWFSTFNFYDKLSFDSVSETRGDGGCRLVIKIVENAKAPAFGIVDRDTLLSDPNFQNTLWWEVDDDIFSSANPYGEKIFVLHRWELENYLLHPLALSTLMEKKQLNTEANPTEIAELLCDHKENMVAITALSTISTKTGTAIAGGNQNLRDKSDKKLKEEIQKQLSVDKLEIESEQIKIVRFAENENDPIKQWHKLSRLLDGKRIMHRIDDLLNEKYRLKPNKVKLESERGALADYIAKHKLIDLALIDWLSEIYQSAV